jgi:hypothetical protein
VRVRFVILLAGVLGAAACGKPAPATPAATCQAAGTVLRGPVLPETRGLEDAIAEACRTDEWPRAVRDCLANAAPAGKDPEACLERLPEDQQATVIALRSGWRPPGDPFLGVEYVGNDTGGGAKVVRVVPGSPAAEIGLREGDFITRFDGRRIDHVSALGERVRAASVGRQVLIEVKRDSSTLILQPVLSENTFRTTR